MIILYIIYCISTSQPAQFSLYTVSQKKRVNFETV